VELEDFWHSFSEDFIHIMRKKKDPTDLAQFQNMFIALVSIALKRMQMSGDQLKYLEAYSSKRNDQDYNYEPEDNNREDSYENDLRELDDKQKYL